MKKSPYYCSAEWHLKQHMGDHIGLAALVYPFALRMAKDSSLFYCSGVRLAGYFECNKDTIYNAIGLLEKIGFFILKAAPPGKQKIYWVLSHSEWADEHPGMCCVKVGHNWGMEYDLDKDGYSSQGIEVTGAVGHSSHKASEHNGQEGV